MAGAQSRTASTIKTWPPKSDPVTWPVGGRIFAALCEHPYGLTSNQLKELVYHPDFEPDAIECISVIVHRMNWWWRDHNSMFRIRARGGPGSTYKLWIARRWPAPKHS